MVVRPAQSNKLRSSKRSKEAPMPDDVHPQIQAFPDTMAALDLPKLQDGSVADARALMEGMAAAGRERLPPMTASLRF